MIPQSMIPRSMIRQRPTRRFSLAIVCCLLAAAGRGALAAEFEQLTHDGRQKFSPVFRDGGREIVFVELVNPTLYQLRRLVLAGGASEPLHAAASTSEFEPAWSADGECYAFLKTRSALSVSVVVCDRRGAKLGEILPADGFCGYRSPALAPDHSRVAFSYAEKGSQQIYSARHDGGDRRALTDSRGINNWPSYSPDGQAIVFGSSRDGNFEIYRMRADGSDARRLTDSPLQDIRPRFSPDGKRIAFTSHRDGNAEIYVMTADGAAPRRVTENEERDDYPDWHPDGERMVVVSEREGKFDLYLLRVPR
jgi:dipeptidyl aminopeptidase/acylaminoacyl peptidase